jgi:hypothetical protein
MRIKAQLIPQRTRGNISIVGSYRDKKTDKEVFLLSSGKKVVSTIDEKERIFQYTFEAGYPVSFNFDTDDFQDKTVIEFWKNHPLVKTDGYTNPNLVSEQFVFEIKEEKVRVEYDALLDKLHCVSIISSMDDNERKDLCFSLGSDPRNMSPKEVMLHLIGLTLNGIGIAKRDQVQLFDKIKGIEKEAMIYANKAVQYNIVGKEGSVYKIAGRTLGTDIDAVKSMIMSDSELFENYIKPEVDKLEESEPKEKELEIPDEIKELLPVESASRKRVARSVK